METTKRSHKVSRRGFALGWPVVLGGALFGLPRVTGALPALDMAGPEKANRVQGLVTALSQEGGIILLGPGQHILFRNVVLKNCTVRICSSSQGAVGNE